MSKFSLNHYGYNDFFIKQQETFTDKNLIPARIISEHKGQYQIITEWGEKSAKLKGSYIYTVQNNEDFPCVGDFVMIDYNNKGEALIYALFERKSKFSRLRSKGRSENRMSSEQVVAANFDYVFIMVSINHNLNLRRIERYLTASWQSGATPVIVLTKADLCNDKSIIHSVENIALGVDIHLISTFTGEGMESLNRYFVQGKTTVFLGSSGVGKSTLVNALMGTDIMKINDIREDDSKGRHTTTYRQLIILPSGGMVVDTPGMRELALWEADDVLSNTFSDIESYALMCRFRDCTHRNEPGCVVREVLKNGTLPIERYESYLKLKKEIQYVESKSNRQIAEQIKKRNKDIAKFSKHLRKGR